MNKKENLIKIYPKGSGHLTNPEKVLMLNEIAPQSFKKAQKLLTVTDRYINKKGLFSNDRGRLKKMQRISYELSKLLSDESFLDKEREENGDAWVVIEFLSLCSSAFPNWQDEYDSLNRFIPQFF